MFAWRSRMGLDIGVVCPEERFGPVSCQVLGHVYNLTASVVPLARISFCVLVGHDRTHGLKHGFSDDKFPEAMSLD